MRVRPLTFGALLVAVACGEPYPSDTPSAGTGGTTNPGSTGGTTGGTSTPSTGGTTGGIANSTGGNQPGTGGAQTGGISSTTGGNQPSTGGASTGGSNATGGNNSGGSNTGGFGKGGTTSGGSNTGGKNSTGGKSSGGASTGGSSTGGGVSTGGSSTGGSGGATGVTFASLCASCHGQKGEGVAMKGPEIQHPVRDFATWVVRNGRQGHPSFPGQVMAAFPASALPDATLTSFFDALSTPTLPKPTTGAALYTDFCANCHSATGTGGTAAHNAKGQTLSKALSMVRSGHSLTQFSVRNGYMPKWSTTELTDAEVGLIVTYLDSL